MSLPVTTLLASVLALIFIILSFRVILLRRSEKVLYGHGESKELQIAIRGHGNFSEYAAFFLVLSLLGELQGMNTGWLSIFGAVFVVGRVIHAYCFAFAKGNFRLRVGGMILSLIAIIALASFNFWHYAM